MSIESRIREQKEKIKEDQRELSRLQDEAVKKNERQFYLVTGARGVPRITSGQDGQWCWFDSNPRYFREVPDPTMHDSVCGHPRTLGEVITDKIVGKSDDFNPASVKTRSQRRAEILHGLTID